MVYHGAAAKLHHQTEAQVADCRQPNVKPNLITTPPLRGVAGTCANYSLHVPSHLFPPIPLPLPRVTGPKERYHREGQRLANKNTHQKSENVLQMMVERLCLFASNDHSSCLLCAMLYDDPRKATTTTTTTTTTVITDSKKYHSNPIMHHPPSPS